MPPRFSENDLAHGRLRYAELPRQRILRLAACVLCSDPADGFCINPALMMGFTGRRPTILHVVSAKTPARIFCVRHRFKVRGVNLLAFTIISNSLRAKEHDPLGEETAAENPPE